MSNEKLTVIYCTYFLSLNTGKWVVLHVFSLNKYKHSLLILQIDVSFLGSQRPSSMWEYIPCTAILQNFKPFSVLCNWKNAQQLGITVVFYSQGTLFTVLRVTQELYILLNKYASWGIWVNESFSSLHYATTSDTSSYLGVLEESQIIMSFNRWLTPLLEVNNGKSKTQIWSHHFQ